ATTTRSARNDPLRHSQTRTNHLVARPRALTLRKSSSTPAKSSRELPSQSILRPRPRR
ncbi:hypothetical protein BJY59DRAFT_725836, partial [Rhodotorula toruloides]